MIIETSFLSNVQKCSCKLHSFIASWWEGKRERCRNVTLFFPHQLSMSNKSSPFDKRGQTYASNIWLKFWHESNLLYFIFINLIGKLNSLTKKGKEKPQFFYQKNKKKQKQDLNFELDYLYLYYKISHIFLTHSDKKCVRKNFSSGTLLMKNSFFLKQSNLAGTCLYPRSNSNLKLRKVPMLLIGKKHQKQKHTTLAWVNESQTRHTIT